MLSTIKLLLSKKGIRCVSAVPVSSCKILRPHKLTRVGLDISDNLTAIMLAVPYYTEHKEKNLSSYAIPRDYHLFFNDLFGEILPTLREKYPEYAFEGFADNSPIDERHAAATAGLGIIGQNNMLITPQYSSYVFLGEIITNAPIDNVTVAPIKYCEGCGACLRACPKQSVGECLSSLTQKKGELDERESTAMISYGSVWGCDICQEVCPHTKTALASREIYTDIDFFKNQCLPIITTEIIDSMSDSEFSQRAYSWRGRSVIRRNLETTEKTKKEQ